MDIYNVYIGKNPIPEKEVTKAIYDEMFGIVPIEIASKRENKDGRPLTTNFFLNGISNQHIKVPKRIAESTAFEETKQKVVEWVDGNPDCHVYMTMTDIYPLQPGPCLDIFLNNMTLAPYVGKNKELKVDSDAKYCILTLDTESVHMVSYETDFSIIGTFRNPAKSIVGCIIKLEKDKSFKMYTHDEFNKFKIKCVTIELADESVGGITFDITSEIPSETVKNLSIQWKKKQKSRTFFYNDYDNLPRAMLSYKSLVGLNIECIQIPTREEAGSNSNYIKSIEKGLRNAFGYIPKAILLDEDVDLEYTEMLRLHFNYVIKKAGNGRYNTLKSS